MDRLPAAHPTAAGVILDDSDGESGLHGPEHRRIVQHGNADAIADTKRYEAVSTSG